MRGTYSQVFHRNQAQRRTNTIVRRTNPRTTPPRYKIFLLTWLAIYPLITVIFLVFGSWLSALPLFLRTLLLTGVLVYLMTYFVMPKLTQVFHGWLSKS
jgi:antibiotic biosynthesis monooxygenase (ABM) superfamily enzyme